LKNANSFTCKYFEKAGWTPVYNHFDTIDKKIIVAYRDPIERWLSGVTQYIYRHKFPNITLNKTVVDILLDIVILDNHTLPQTDYLNNINTDDCIFFIVNENYTKNLSSFTSKTLNIELEDYNFWQNKTIENSDKVYIYNTIKKHMNTNLHRLHHYYKKDLEVFQYIMENTNERTYR
jgi:hypothetical protein